MTLDLWIEKLRNLMGSRFVCDPSSELTTGLRRLAGEGFAAEVLLVRRASAKPVGFRTVLLASAESLKASAGALHWAASVRDALPEPAASDLYLFLDVTTVSLEDCLRLEADDLYCRKYVKRPGESDEAFVKRTFLATPVSARRAGDMADPLSASLLETAKSHEWFSHEHQQRWRDEMLSGANAPDLATRLFEPEEGRST